MINGQTLVQDTAGHGVIFLSPHYDDAVLSCGGTIAAFVQAGNVPVVITVFGGEVPDEIITDFAKWKHSRWGARDVEDIVVRRQGEDGHAVELLGAQSRWLGYPDAIYRGDRYVSDPSLFGTPQEVEQGLVDLIVTELRRLPEWDDAGMVFVPLGIGGHVDHQLVFAAGQLLAAAGTYVMAYEDCPYAIHTPAGVDRRLAAVADAVDSALCVPIGETLGRRIAAIEEYTTQVPVIFRFTTDMPAAVAEFARKTGGPLGPAERFWPVRGSATQITQRLAEGAAHEA